MILVDAGPLVALCDARDRLHATATRDFDKALPSGLLICDAVLVEAVFLLTTPEQRRRLGRLLEYANATALRIDETVWAAVFDWLVKYSDHQPDWADGCLAVLAGRDRRYRVWTYDGEFRTIWRRPDGTAIPLFRR